MNSVPNVAASYQPYPHNTTNTPEQLAKLANEAALAQSGTSAAAQVNHTATSVISDSNAPSTEILPELSPELLVIIAGYENKIMEADWRIALYALERLLKDLTGKPEFENEINRINAMIHRGQPSAMQDAMRKIFDEVITNRSQISSEEEHETPLCVLKATEMDSVESVEEHR